MSGIMCCACVTLAISVLQFALLQMAKRFQEASGEERVTAKSKPMMNLIAKMPSVVSFSTSKSPGKRYYGNEDPWRSVAGEDRPGQLGKETVFLESFSSTDYSKLDYDHVWSSQEWKSEVTAHDRSGQPDKTSWSMVQQVRPHHGETLLGGDAQSVRYRGILRDWSGRPDNIISQEVANSAKFVMGSDAEEFVNKVNDQVRKRQKRMSNVARSGEELYGSSQFVFLLKPLSRHRMHDPGWHHDKGGWSVSHSDANRDSTSSAVMAWMRNVSVQHHTRDKNADHTRNSQQHVLYTWSLTRLLAVRRSVTQRQWDLQKVSRSGTSWASIGM